MRTDVFNLRDQAQMTELTNRAVQRILGPDRERIASQFAPLKGTQADKIGREQVKIKAVGRGRMIADDATPPIWRPKLKFVEEAWELIRLSEMTPVEESLRRQLELNGTDAESKERRQRAGAQIISRVAGLAVREENQSDYMVMEAITTGELAIDLANPPEGDVSQEYVIDYEFPSGHLAIVGTSWADLTNGVPITNMRTYQEKLKAATGDYGTEFWMSSKAWQYVLASKQVRDSLTANVGPQYISTEQHVKNLLYEPERVTFRLTDEGWYDEDAGYDVYLDATKTRWLPENRMLVLSRKTGDADPIATMYDGMVPVQTSWDEYEYRGPGGQTYRQLIQGNLTIMIRREARRIPMIHHPENIISAQVIL